MTAKLKRVTVSILTLILTLTAMYSFIRTVSADEIPDDPNDGIVTASERKTDLLGEVHDDAPTISAASYVLYDADSGSILLGSDYNVQI